MQPFGNNAVVLYTAVFSSTPHARAIRDTMAQLTPLKCPCCDAPLTPPVGRGQFYCQFCGTPVSRPHTSGRDEPADSCTDEPQAAVAVPEKIEVEELGGDLRISWRWFNWSVLFLIPFCIAWNAFLIGWYSIALSEDGPPGAFRFIMLVFPVAHVAVGLGILYACLVMLFNRTVIRVSYGNLSIQHGPIPAPGNRTIPVDDIDQLYVKHERHHSKNGTSHRYPLQARLKSGREVKLLPRNSELDVARAVEHLVETHLGIENRPVAGEHRD